MENKNQQINSPLHQLAHKIVELIKSGADLSQAESKIHQFIQDIERTDIKQSRQEVIFKNDQYKNKLQELSAQNEAILASIPDIIMQVDNNKIYTWANKAGYDFFGTDVIGKPASYYFEGEQKTYNAVSPLFSGNKDHIYIESWQKRVDGEKRLLAWRCQVLKDNQGNITGVLSSANDITEERKRQEKLRESEERFRIIASNTPDHIIVHDMELRYTTVINPQLGLTETDMLGKTDFDFLNKEEAGKLTAVKRKVLATGKPYHLETSLKNKKNKPEFFNGSFIPKLDSEGKINGLIGYFKNITERRFAENALQKSRSELQEYFENDISADFTVSVDGKIISCNRTFLRLFGFENELHTKKINIVKLYKNPNDRKRLIKQLIRNGKVENYEIDFKTIDGKNINTIINAIGLVNNRNKLVKIRGYVVDISDRKKVEQELEQNKELFSLFMKHSPFYAYIKEVNPTQSRVIQASDNFIEMLGLQSKKMIGKTMEELFPPEFAKKITADDWSVVNNGQILQVEEELNGRYYTTIKFPIIQGEKKLLAGYTIDITDRKQAEEKLKTSHALLDKLAAQVPGVVYKYRLYSDGQSAFPYSSSGMNDIYEVTPEEVQTDASPVFTRIHPDDYNYIVESINKSAQNLSLYHSEFRVILPKQGLRWRLCDAKPERMEDGSTLWYGIITDITERKLAEEELAKYRNHLEDLVKERTLDLEEKNEKLENFNKLFIGRELRIKELKDKVAKLEKQLEGKK